jgi:hypothetical protein
VPVHDTHASGRPPCPCRSTSARSRVRAPARRCPGTGPVRGQSSPAPTGSQRPSFMIQYTLTPQRVRSSAERDGRCRARSVAGCRRRIGLSWHGWRWWRPGGDHPPRAAPPASPRGRPRPPVGGLPSSACSFGWALGRGLSTGSGGCSRPAHPLGGAGGWMSGARRVARVGAAGLR